MKVKFMEVLFAFNDIYARAENVIKWVRHYGTDDVVITPELIAEALPIFGGVFFDSLFQLSTGNKVNRKALRDLDDRQRKHLRKMCKAYDKERKPFKNSLAKIDKEEDVARSAHDMQCKAEIEALNTKLFCDFLAAFHAQGAKS